MQFHAAAMVPRQAAAMAQRQKVKIALAVELKHAMAQRPQQETVLAAPAAESAQASLSSLERQASQASARLVSPQMFRGSALDRPAPLARSME